MNISVNLWHQLRMTSDYLVGTTTLQCCASVSICCSEHQTLFFFLRITFLQKVRNFKTEYLAGVWTKHLSVTFRLKLIGSRNCFSKASHWVWATRVDSSHTQHPRNTLPIWLGLIQTFLVLATNTYVGVQQNCISFELESSCFSK